MRNYLKKLRKEHTPPTPDSVHGILDVAKHIGPGLLVTVGFIDPGNWASNFAAGSQFGYALLWVVTLSTIMLIILQHNVAHLGIVTGLCLSEAVNKYLPRKASRAVLWSAMGASVSTSLAEILGGAIALQMLFHVPVKIGSILVTVFILIMMFSSSYKKIEKYIIAFVSLIGLSFIYELFLVDVAWGEAAKSWVVPSIPSGSILIIMSVLGAVVMPHNLFLHSEIVQSHQWNKRSDAVIRRELKYEYADTIFSMIVGWAINSAMILLAASTFFKQGIVVNDLQQAKEMLEPLLSGKAALVFALALFLAGTSSSMTSAFAAGSIFSGMYDEPYNIKDIHSKTGIFISIGLALVIIFLIQDPFKGLIISQAILSVQLPVTVFSQVRLTSSKKVMGKYANKPFTKYLLYSIAIIVTGLNILLLYSLFKE